MTSVYRRYIYNFTHNNNQQISCFRLDKIAIKTYFKKCEARNKWTLEQRSRKFMMSVKTHNYMVFTRCQALSFKCNDRIGFFSFGWAMRANIVNEMEKKKWFLFYSIERSSRILFINHSLFLFFFYDLCFFRWYRAKPKPRMQT